MSELRKQEFEHHTLPNGVTVLGERMDAVSSAALVVMLPVGAATDPEGKEGTSSLLAEMLGKGAGNFNSRELSQQFENIGVHRGASAGIEVSTLSASMLGENTKRAIELTGLLLREPQLPADELDPVKQLALQDLEALEDEPASKVMTELAAQFYPAPFGRSQLGTKEGVNAVTIESLKRYYQERFVPDRAIVAVAGRFDWQEVLASVEGVMGGWTGSSASLTVPPLSGESKVHHLEQDTAQVQIALAYPSVAIGHKDFYVARVATNVLSGGMSGRLFIEVREKRGLVYRVGASHSAAKGRGAIFAYAGTTPENAEECLKVMLAELRRLGEGVEEEELERAKADLKSRVIMQGEFSSSRASGLVNDWWNLGRIRTLSEIRDAIDSVTSADIERHMREFPVAPVTLVTLGPKALELPN